MMQDVSSVTLVQSIDGVTKEVQAKLFKPEVASSQMVQHGVINLVWMIIRIISSKNASSAPQNLDLLQQTLDLSLKVVDNTGLEGIYPFSLKLVYSTSCIIKLISRPRMEE
jgi:hypothetical protein